MIILEDGELITNTQKLERIETVSTVSTSHFTESLSMNRYENEDVTGLLSNKIMIVDINGQSDQNLKYRLVFWSSVNKNSTNLDTDYFLGDVVMDFSDTNNAYQLLNSAGTYSQYYLDISGLDLLYEDTDLTNTLHVSIQNMSAVSKNAGSTGRVQFDIKYSLRL